jgi:hypothetical protein
MTERGRRTCASSVTCRDSSVGPIIVLYRGWEIREGFPPLRLFTTGYQIGYNHTVSPLSPATVGGEIR